MILQCGDRIKIDNDMWETSRTVFTVISAKPQPNSTAIRLVVEDDIEGKIIMCVVSENQIEKL